MKLKSSVWLCLTFKHHEDCSLNRGYNRHLNRWQT